MLKRRSNNKTGLTASYSRRSPTTSRILVRLGATAGLAVALASCGGGSGGGTVAPTSSTVSSLGDGNAVGPPADTSQNAWPIETGPAQTIVAVGSTPGAVVALFPDGAAYYSPDGYNLAGGGNSRMAYAGPPSIVQIAPAGGGVVALFASGQAYFSPDGMNLGGGGATLVASNPLLSVLSIVAVPSGIDAIAGSDSAVYFSPTGLGLTGGHGTTIAFGGGQVVSQIVPVGPGDAVLTLMANGAAYYSPDNRLLGGGGATISATSTTGGKIVRLVPAGGGGLFTEVAVPYSSGIQPEDEVFYSADGKDITGGGATVRVDDWQQLGRANFGVRDSAQGAVFQGRLFLSGGFRGYLGSNSCFYTCSYFDLWASSDLSGASFGTAPVFQTASAPNPRDAQSEVNNGVLDDPQPTDFYDAYSPIVVWQGQLVAIGDTIWTSSDGSTWQRQNHPDGTPIDGPEPRRAGENSRAVVFGSYLYFIEQQTGDVQRTASGNASVWTDLGPIPNFGSRCGAIVFVTAGRLWLEGGGACDYSATYNDIWYTDDGLNWYHSDRVAAWSPRLWSCVAVDASGVAWMVGGFTATDWNNVGGVLSRRYSVNFDDAWYSKNGVDWHQFKAELGSQLPDDGVLFSVHAPTCLIGQASDGSPQLVVIAGKSGPDANDHDSNVGNFVQTLHLPTAAELP